MATLESEDEYRSPYYRIWALAVERLESRSASSLVTEIGGRRCRCDGKAVDFRVTHVKLVPSVVVARHEL
jgi:hypothetical protein